MPITWLSTVIEKDLHQWDYLFASGETKNSLTKTIHRAQRNLVSSVDRHPLSNYTTHFLEQNSDDKIYFGKI